MSKRFNIHDEATSSMVYFYQVPKFLFKKELEINSDAKLVYSLLKNRHNISTIKKRTNRQGDIVVIYPREKMAELLNISVPTVRKAFQRLEMLGLIEEERQGPNKPNLIYLTKVEDLIDLKGDSYKSKRNEINRFRNVYPNHKIEILDKEKHGSAVMALFNKWVRDRTTYMPKEEVEVFMDGIYFERFAIKRLMNDYNNLDIIGLVIYIDDEVKGFTVGEKINQHTASVIIEKTDFEVLGCAQFIFREFTKILKDKYAVEYINVGDDMGFENLKKVKMSYRPKKLVPKYTIYQK